MLAAAAALLVLSACGSDEPLIPPGRPNILLLVIDCLRADHVGINGYERPTTPTLDELAAEGTNFTNAFSPSHWTRPSLPSLLTGLYPTEHGLMTLGAEEEGDDHGGAGDLPSAAAEELVLAPQVETLAEKLKGLGYSTAMVGYQAQLSRRFGLDQGFDFYRAKSVNGMRTNQAFLRWATREGRQPFFAYLHYLEVHWPYCPPPHTRGRFTTTESDINFCGEWRNVRAQIRRGELLLDDDDVEVVRSLYDEELVGLDGSIGWLFRRIKRAGLWDDTLIAVTSDHGEEFYERGGVGHSGHIHDELIHVPLIIKPPASWGAPAGQQVDSLVEMRDLTETFLHTAGMAVEGPSWSLVPWVMGRPDRARRREYVVAEGQYEYVIRTDALKLIAEREGASAELYDLIADPGETVNVASSRRRELAYMRGLAEEWLASLEPVTPESREITEQTLDELRALGYLD